jgi:hypothetical protein
MTRWRAAYGCVVLLAGMGLALCLGFLIAFVLLILERG